MLPPRDGRNPFGLPPASWWIAGFAAGFLYHMWVATDVVVGTGATMLLLAYVYFLCMPQGGIEATWTRNQKKLRAAKKHSPPDDHAD